MAGRYPNTLFHFTCEKTNLFGILENNFKLSYAREALFGTSSSNALAVPMVSFCDLRLSELARHMTTYGHYGIGLSKNWAIRSKLNPVSYWSKDAVLPEMLMRNLDLLKAHVETLDIGQHTEMTRVYTNFCELFKYLKNYEGTLTRKGVTEKNFRFADEREWRYVPVWESIPDVRLLDVDTHEKKAAMNQRLCKMSLVFDPDDIHYLIVQEESEREEIIKHIRHVKEKHYDTATVARLSSRILTSSQIIDDM